MTSDFINLVKKIVSPNRNSSNFPISFEGIIIQMRKRNISLIPTQNNFFVTVTDVQATLSS